MKNVILGGLALAASLAALPATAADYMFTLTDGENTAVWSLPQAPTPTSAAENEYFSIYETIDGTYNGEDVVFLGFDFYTEESEGGFATIDLTSLGPLPPGPSYNTTGPQLFTGPTSAPVFKTGTFYLYDYCGGCNANVPSIQAIPDGAYQLVISEGGGAVPEPAAWALMISGFAGAGSALRRQRKPVAA
jgi:hypothetical protein